MRSDPLASDKPPLAEPLDLTRSRSGTRAGPTIYGPAVRFCPRLIRFSAYGQRHGMQKRLIKNMIGLPVLKARDIRPRDDQILPDGTLTLRGIHAQDNGA